MFKKIIAALLVTVSLFSASACTAPTENISNGTPMPPATEAPIPTPPPDTTPDFPEYPMESVQLLELSEYSIVYSEKYTEYQVESIYLLRDVIKTTLGFDVDVKSDITESTGKEIILASSSRQTGINESIDMLPHGLDYVVGTLNKNIILGGNNFYADMRAIYDFINNYLGYDDIENSKISDPLSELSGVNISLYEKPELVIYACNYAVDPFLEQFAIRDMADAHFNMVTVYSYWYSDKDLLNFLKWCARFEIYAILFVHDSMKPELYYDCPIIWGHCIMDEPGPGMFIECSQRADEYLKTYGHLGWKPFINYAGFASVADAAYNLDWFENIPVVSFDRYFGNDFFNHPFRDNHHILYVYEKFADMAKRKGQDLWSYIETYNNTNWDIHTEKQLRWTSYIALSFGAKGILYFQYGDASRNHTSEGDWTKGSLINWDYTKNQAWYDAQKNNAELLKLAELYNRYSHDFSYTLNVYDKGDDNSVAHLIADYRVFDDVLTEVQDSKTRYLVGTFSETYGAGKAFTLVNLENITGDEYKSDAKPVKMKINGKNIKFYFEGELVDIQRDSDGYYDVPMGNGYCYFVTVD